MLTKLLFFIFLAAYSADAFNHNCIGYWIVGNLTAAYHGTPGFGSDVMSTESDQWSRYIYPVGNARLVMPGLSGCLNRSHPLNQFTGNPNSIMDVTNDTKYVMDVTDVFPYGCWPYVHNSTPARAEVVSTNRCFGEAAGRVQALRIPVGTCQLYHNLLAERMFTHEFTELETLLVATVPGGTRNDLMWFLYRYDGLREFPGLLAAFNHYAQAAADEMLAERERGGRPSYVVANSCNIGQIYQEYAVEKMLYVRVK